MGTIDQYAPRLVEDVGWFPIDHAGAVGIARRAAVGAAGQLGLAANRLAELEIAIAEIGSNLHRHADEGWLVVRSLRQAGENGTVYGGLEVVAIDGGPGMADAVAAGRDGYSTGGTLGIGMGAIDRLSTYIDTYSLPGRGTVVVVQFWPAGLAVTEPDAAGMSRPIRGEQVCGDRFAVRPADDGWLVLLADGLGHGVLAAAAASAAVEAFLRCELADPAGVVNHLHRRLAHTRGAALSVARLEPSRGLVRFAGLGNVNGFVAGPDGRRRGMVTLPGIAGHQARTVREFEYPVGPGDLVVVQSDGVTDRWNLGDYPGLSGRGALTIAATLLRDAGVRHDDRCVLVAKAAP